MQSFRAPRATTNPYIHMLDDALADTEGIDHVRFSWRGAFFGRLDAIHFHWPEVLLGGRTPLRRAVKRLRLQALLTTLRLKRVAIVRTVHNLELPSDLTPWERRMLESVRRRAAVAIALNETTAAADPTVVTIPHGHYVEWFADEPRAQAQPGRIGFVGLVRRYKGVESLIDAYGELTRGRDGVSLAIDGSPTSSELADELRRRASDLPAVTFTFAYLSEADYARAVTASALIVLPYTHMHNSGSVLAALSLDRPVLVPRNEVNEALREEVGSAWVQMFDPPLAGEHLADALDAVSDDALVDASPDLSARGWDETGRRHLEAYLTATASRRGSRR